MIKANIRIEAPSDNPSMAQQSLDLWTSSWGLAATMAAMASPFELHMAMVRLNRSWMGHLFPGSAGARMD